MSVFYVLLCALLLSALCVLRFAFLCVPFVDVCSACVCSRFCFAVVACCLHVVVLVAFRCVCVSFVRMFFCLLLLLFVVCVFVII